MNTAAMEDSVLLIKLQSFGFYHSKKIKGMLGRWINLLAKLLGWNFLYIIYKMRSQIPRKRTAKIIVEWIAGMEAEKVTYQINVQRTLIHLWITWSKECAYSLSCLKVSIAPTSWSLPLISITFRVWCNLWCCWRSISSGNKMDKQRYE